MKKRIIALLLAMVMVISMVGCVGQAIVPQNMTGTEGEIVEDSTVTPTPIVSSEPADDEDEDDADIDDDDEDDDEVIVTPTPTPAVTAAPITPINDDDDDLTKAYLEKTHGAASNPVYYATGECPTATINGNSVTLYDHFEDGDSGINYTTLSGASGAAIELIAKVTYNDGFVLYYYDYLGNDSAINNVTNQYQFISSANVTLDTEATPTPEVTVTPTPTPEVSPTPTPDEGEGDEDDGEFTETLTLDFLPTGLTAESGAPDATNATIKGTTAKLYKSLDNGAAGIEVTVDEGTQIYLLTKYTFTTDSGSLVFYRYDYTGSNTELANAAISEYSGYVFVYAGDITLVGASDDDLTPTEKTDSATGVKINADLPSDVTLKVSTKTLAESGIDTTVYPINGASLFYDVTLQQNSAEYQPENGITITFPESAITESGLAVGDYYKVYHVHDGATDVTGPFEYTGGDIDANFDSLSVVGVASTESINPTTVFGEYQGKESYYGYAVIKNDSIRVYGDMIEVSTTDYIDYTGVKGIKVELFNYKVSYANDAFYQYAYVGDENFKSDYFISEDDITLTCCENCTGEADCACSDTCTCGDSDDAALQPTYESLMETGCLADFEAIYKELDEATVEALEASSYWTEIQEHNYHLVYSHFYSVGTETEYNAIITAYPDAWAYIQADEDLYKYNLLHLERIRYVVANPEIKLELSDEVIPVTYPSYTNAADLVEVPTAATAAAYLESGISAFSLLSATSETEYESAADALTADTNGNGIVLNKKVTTFDGTKGTIRLEAYATGSKVTTATTKELPADIILVLDLSNSMEHSMDNVSRQQITSGTAAQVYAEYGSDVWVKIGDEYKEVTITGNGGTTGTTYTAYEETSSGGGMGDHDGNNSNYKASELYEYIQDNDLYYKADDGKYYKVSAEEKEESGHRRYYISYVDSNGTTQYIANGVDRNTTINSTTYQFYTASTGTVYESYTFTYTAADGSTVTKTYTATQSIVSDSDPEYYAMQADGTTIQKNAALVNAVTAFKNEVAEKAKGTDGTLNTDDDIAHCIAIVGFSGSDKSNTGVYIGSTIDKYSDGVSDANYQNALQDMSTTTGVTNVTASIGALNNEQGTYTYCGTDMACKILDKKLAQEPNRYVKDGETIRTKVVVIFTDGEPNGTNAYDAPIEDTFYLKHTHSATVYTVGILDDGSVTPIPPTTTINQYMHYMSSNYQNATSMDSPGDFTNTQYAVDGSSYYMLASNSNDLYNIFSAISSSATSGGSSTTLNESAEVRDLISPYFQLPENATTDSIKVYTSAYKYDETNGIYWDDPATYAATVEIDGKNIHVSNFDYAENWVGTETAADGTVTYRGKKLIIEVPFVVEENFLGGDDVITNGSDFAIYESSSSTEALETVESPIVDVDLKPITNVAQDKHIYLTNTTDLTGILDLYIRVDETEENNLKIVADGVNNAYVNLVYDVTVTLADGSIATYTYTVPAGKTWAEGTWSGSSDDLTQLALSETTQYSVTCTMTSKNDTTKSVTSTDTGTIYVYKPELTFADAVKVPNVDTVNYNGENYVASATVWKNGTTVAGTQMEGIEPALTLTYDDGGNKVDDNNVVIVTNDYYVNVTVTANSQDITSATTFNHATCTHTGCAFDKTQGEFIIHIKTGKLTISKTVGGYTGTDLSFTFTVTVLDGTPKTVTLKNGESETLEGLLPGSYTITETLPTEPTGWWYKSTTINGTEDADRQTSATVTAGSETTVAYVNNYEQRGNLTIVKELPGFSAAFGTYTFTVTDESGQTKTVVLGGTVSDIVGALVTSEMTYTIPNLIPGEYTVVETTPESANGYEYLSTSYKVNNGTAANGLSASVDVVSGDTAVVTYLNYYQEIGNLQITKTVEGYTGDKSFTFEVKKGDSVVDTFTLKNGESKMLRGLVVGDYTITETDYEAPEDYEYLGTEITGANEGATVSSATATVTRDTTTKVTYTNNYQGLGNLTVSKNVAEPTGVTLNAKDYTFTVNVGTGLNGKTYNVTGLAATTSVTVADGKFTLKLADGESATIVNLPTDTAYTVTEAEANQNGFTTTSTGATGTIATGKTATAAFTNTYSADLGNLVITKNITEYAYDNHVGGTFAFTVTGTTTAQPGTYNVKIGNTDAQVTVTAGDNGNTVAFAATAEIAVTLTAAQDTNSLTITGLPAGTYTVTEIDDQTQNYDFDTTPKTATVNATTDGAVAVTNSYPRQTEKLTITKTLVNGSTRNVTDTFTFKVTMPADVDYDDYAANLKVTSGYTLTRVDDRTFTVAISVTANRNSEASASVVIENLPTGDYTVEEIATTTGQLAKYDVDIDAATAGNQTSVEVAIMDKQSTSVTCVNTVITGTLVINKTASGSSDNFLFHVKNSDGSVKMDVMVPANGSVTITKLPLGTYTVTEDTEWSWRYNLTGDPTWTDGNVLSESNLDIEVSFTNTLKTDKWLNDVDTIDNVFTAAAN